MHLPAPRKNVIFLFLLLIFLGIEGTSDLEPWIESRGSSLSLPQGESAELECKIRNLGERHIVWRRGYDVLATELLVLSPDSRISVKGSGGVFYLTLRDINSHDSGEYVCQISTTSGATNLISVTHSLDVLVPAKILHNPETSNLTVSEGEDAVLECRATGNPQPSIVWRKQGEFGGLLSYDCGNGSCVRLSAITRKEEGVYSCTAANKIGSDHTAHISLTVLYPPDITAVEDQVQAGPGGTVRLECQVDGEPTPSITWYFGPSQLYPSGSVAIFQGEGGRHSVVLSGTSVESFGNYSCLAENSLGTAKKFIEVHGRPSAVQFTPRSSRAGKTFYQLAWQVQSFTQILEYRLLYRRIAKDTDKKVVSVGSDWTNVIIPGEDIYYSGNTKKMSWTLDDLIPECDYECLVQAKNRYGWSHPSKMFTFSTSLNSLTSAATQGLNWNYPSSSSSSRSQQLPVSLLAQLHVSLLTAILGSLLVSAKLQ